jgi:hypothetical protein
MRVVLLLATAILAVVALPAEIPEPSELALLLGEEEFEDYLDSWLALEQSKWTNSTADADPRSGKIMLL